MKSSGWHLGEKLGKTNVYAVFPHSPVLSNRGEVSGRIALGLFETAFDVDEPALAFPLDHGPFGEQVFDASLDVRTTDAFRRGYDAYLYLGPLEGEIVSPLIPGFYTDAYALEVDRRCKLMSGKTAVEAYSLSQLRGTNLAKMRAVWWGQPRREWSAKRLGPLNAWQWGSDWEKKSIEAKHQDWGDTKAIAQAAQRLLEAIRRADYASPGDWQQFPAPDVDYQVYTDYPAWMNWICTHFRTNPIVSVNLGEVVRHTDGWPCVSYQLTLKNATVLKGVLPFQWNARGEEWYGVHGLDWHLKPTEPGRPNRRTVGP